SYSGCLRLPTLATLVSETSALRLAVVSPCAPSACSVHSGTGLLRLPRILLLLPLLPAGAASEAGAAEEAAEEPRISAIRLPERLSLSVCAEPTEAASETEAEASLWGQSPSPSDDESPCKEACKETEGGEDELTLVLHS